jgi:hypothetical protein
VLHTPYFPLRGVPFHLITQAILSCLKLFASRYSKRFVDY